MMLMRKDSSRPAAITDMADKLMPSTSRVFSLIRDEDFLRRYGYITAFTSGIIRRTITWSAMLSQAWGIFSFVRVFLFELDY